MSTVKNNCNSWWFDPQGEKREKENIENQECFSMNKRIVTGQIDPSTNPLGATNNVFCQAIQNDLRTGQLIARLSIYVFKNASKITGYEQTLVHQYIRCIHVHHPEKLEDLHNELLENNSDQYAADRESQITLQNIALKVALDNFYPNGTSPISLEDGSDELDQLSAEIVMLNAREKEVFLRKPIRENLKSLVIVSKELLDKFLTPSTADCQDMDVER